jgi:two-component system response regulator
MGVEAVEILLVEDNPYDAELTLRALKRSNLANEVLVLSDGAQALDFLFGQGAYSDRDPAAQPRIMLLDLKLPKVDGLEVLRRVKEDPRTRLIPIIVLTSSHEEGDIVASYLHGVNSYIVKPVEFEDFVEVVSRLGLYWLLVNRLPGTG